MKAKKKNPKKFSFTRTMFKSKIHRATVTDASLDYEGSITIDENLLKKADIIPHEQVAIYNVTNGNRFHTYAIPGKPGNGDICLNGAAAHKCKKGDLIIIATYTQMDTEQALRHQPTVVRVDAKNRPLEMEMKTASSTKREKRPTLPHRAHLVQKQM